MAAKLPPMGMAGLAGLTGVPTGGAPTGPAAAPAGMPAAQATPSGSMVPRRPQLDKLGQAAPTLSAVPGQSGKSSVFAPFGFDAKGNPITTPPPGWKYFSWDGTPVAPAPATGGWSEADRAQAVFGPEAQAPDFADTGGEGADMYEMGLIPQDQIFLPVGAKLNVPLTPESKVKPKSKVGKVSMRRSGGKIAR